MSLISNTLGTPERVLGFRSDHTPNASDQVNPHRSSYSSQVNFATHSTEGNLVNALDNANPSRLLLHAIQNHPSVATQNISKELQLYLGTLKQEDSQHKVFLFHDGVAHSHSLIPSLAGPVIPHYIRRSVTRLNSPRLRLRSP